MEFIDIHSHYAWDIDDGIASLEDAKKALVKASNCYSPYYTRDY